MRKSFTIFLLSVSLLAACQEEEPILPPPSDDDVEQPVEPVIPEEPQDKIIEPISSASMTFCYYDIQGVVNNELCRVDFNLEVYGTDTPDLRNIQLTFDFNEGFGLANLSENTITKTLSIEKATKVTFVSQSDTVDFDVYVNRIVKQAAVTEFTFHAGINLSYWFQEEVPWPNYDVLQQAKDFGFDHVRLPVDSFVLFDSKGNIKRDVMNQIHGVIGKCRDLSLKVIFDMHWLENGNLFYKNEAADELVNNWRKLMLELRRYPNDFLAYEILNEPYGPGWLLMQRRMLHLIRHSEPERVVFVYGEGYDSTACSKLYMHEGDPNLIMKFHYYEPMLASHKKLWGYTGPSHYPGYLFSDEEFDAMSSSNQEIAQWHRGVYYDYDYAYAKISACAQQGIHNGLRVQCGEFGMSKTNDKDDRLQWFRDVVKAFNECDIAYTVWENWGGDFGPGNWAGEPDEEVIDILLQR